MAQENAERSAEDKALNDRLDKEIRDREEACAQLQNRFENMFYSLIFLVINSLISSQIDMQGNSQFSEWMNKMLSVQEIWTN